jgi:hypothetical protein
MANIYERGPVFELRQVNEVKEMPADPRKWGHKGGLSIGHGKLGCNSVTEDMWDSRFTSKDIKLGDIIKIRFDGPAVAAIEEIYRQDMKIFPVPDREQLKEIKKFVKSSEKRK